MNIIFVISDTLRRDHLGCYGNKIIHTPHIDRFSERCVVFDRAYCTSFPTVPMRADLFTGTFTFSYLGWAPLPTDITTLQKAFSDGGYRTMGIVDVPFLARNGLGYDRGFHDFRHVRGQGGHHGIGGDRDDTNYERRYEQDYCAPMTFAHAERWIERHYKEDFFLYIDTWDPHEPWDPPAHYVELYKPDWDGAYVDPPYGYWKKAGLTPEQIEIANACYNGEVTMVDHAFGRLVDRIESMGLMEKTVIFFTSDHGFCLGEHGLLGKAVMEQGRFMESPLYEEITRVPLMAYIPGIKPRRTSAITSVPDYMPTLLDLAGIDIPDSVQGKSLLPLIKGDTDRHRDFNVTTMRLRNPGEITRAVDDTERIVQQHLTATITTDEWTLLYATEGTPAELYNTASDPKQQNNVIDKNGDVAQELHKKYYDLLVDIGTEEHLLKLRSKL